MTKKNKILYGIAILAGVVAVYCSVKAKATTVTLTDAVKNSTGQLQFVVGGYDAANNRTYIYTAGNASVGFYIAGPVNAAQGTKFYAN